MADGIDIDKLTVFISYSRDDLAFADQLDAALGLQGFTTTLDRHGISGAEDWKARLGSLIRNSDTVVFVLSPSSATSDICAWEVGEAVRFGKRIIPVLCRSLDDTDPPPQLADLNYVYFYAEPKMPGAGFGTGLVKLASALNTDLNWLREHTRLLQRATEWHAGGRPANRLLSGADILEAKGWAARRPRNAPEPTELHLDFVKASEAWEAEQLREESQRLSEREQLVAAAELAQRQRDAEVQRVAHRTRMGLLAAVVLSLMAGSFGIFALHQQRDARSQRNIALMQKQEAENQKLQAQAEAGRAESAAKLAGAARDEALLTQSRFLTDLARQALEKQDGTTSLLLALEALPDGASDDQTVRSRPHWFAAEVNLGAAVRTLEELQLLHGHAREVTSLAMSPDGKFYISGSQDNTARVWDSNSGAEISSFTGHSSQVRAVAMMPDGARVVSGSWDRTARIWDARSARQLLVLNHPSSVQSVAVTPDGSRIVTGSDDRTARIWDARTGTELLVLKGHGDRITSVAVSPDGSRIVTGSNDTTARVWDAKTGDEILVLKGHAKDVSGVAITSDASRIVTSSDKSVRVWDANTGAELLIMNETDGGGVRGVVTVDDGRVLSVASSGWRAWDGTNGTQRGDIFRSRGSAYAIAASADGARVIVGGYDGSIWVWNTQPKRKHLIFRGHADGVSSIASTSDGRRVISGSLDGAVRVWNSHTGEEVLHLRGHTGRIHSVVVTPDDSRIVTGSTDGSVRVWNANSGAQLNHFTSREHSSIRSLAMTPDGTRIILGSFKAAQVWDLNSGALLATLANHASDVTSVAVTANGALLVTGSQDRTVRVWDSGTYAQVAVSSGILAPITSVLVNEDGSRIIIGSEDRTVRIWDFKTGKIVGMLGNAYDIALTPNRDRIVVNTFSGLKYMDVQSGAELGVFEPNRGPLARASRMVVTPDGKRLVAAVQKDVYLLELLPSGQALVDLAKVRTPRCLTPAERHRLFLASPPPSWCAAMNK